MKRRVLQFSVVAALAITSCWGGIIADNNASDFLNPIDWCQFGCQGGQLGTPTAYTGAGGGLVGLTGIGQNLQNLQQGNGWSGDFNSGMGILYNGVETLENSPADIGLYFNQGHNGVGAYISTDQFGAFTATITLYDQNFNVLGSFSENGTASSDPGTAIFIGAMDSTGSDSIYAAVFDASVSGSGAAPDFAIGTAILDAQGGGGGVPEPGTLLPVALGLLGLAPFARRLSRKNSRRTL